MVRIELRQLGRGPLEPLVFGLELLLEQFDVMLPLAQDIGDARDVHECRRSGL